MSDQGPIGGRGRQPVQGSPQPPLRLAAPERRAVRHARSLLRILAPLLVLVALLVATGSLARVLGPPIRRAAVIAHETTPAGSVVAFDDATPQAGAFLAARDTVVVVVPWTMRARDLVRLYHLDDGPSLRRALATQLSVHDLDDILEAGSRVSLTLTPPRRSP